MVSPTLHGFPEPPKLFVNNTRKHAPEAYEAADSSWYQIDYTLRQERDWSE